MVEQEYLELRDAVDTLAARIRSLSFFSPGSYRQFSARTSIEEAPAEVPETMEMVRQLMRGHETIARVACAVIPHQG